MKFIIILYLNHFLDFKFIFIYFTAKHTNLIIVNLITTINFIKLIKRLIVIIDLLYHFKFNINFTTTILILFLIITLLINLLSIVISVF